MIQPLESFETKRLKARKMTEEDLPLFHLMNSNTDMMATLGGICDKIETNKRFIWNLNQWVTYGFGQCFFFDKITNEVVGRGGIRRLEIDGSEETEIAYALLPSFWGRGLAAEIAKKCVKIGFEYYKNSSLIAGTQATNKASQKVIIKSGFEFEKEIFQYGAKQFVYRQLNSMLLMCVFRLFGGGFVTLFFGHVLGCLKLVENQI